MEARTCPTCGTMLKAGDTFCEVCGTAVNNQQPSNQQYQAPYQQAPYQQPPYQQPPYQQAPNGGYYPPYPPQPPVYLKPAVPGKGLGIAAMVLGIFAIIYGILTVKSAIEYADMLERLRSSIYGAYYSSPDMTDEVVGIIIISVFAILSTIFGGCALKKGYRNGISVSGLVMGSLGLICSIVSIIIVASC